MKSEREKNRENFPEIAKIIDEFRKEFGEVKLLWGQENEKEIGKRIVSGNCVLAINMVIEVKKNEKRKN